MSENGFSQPAKASNADEYLSSERRASSRNELAGGKILAKAGSNRWQSLIASNAAIAIGSRLKGNKSDVYINDMRVQLKRDQVCYPNVVIVNGEPIFADVNNDQLTNPTVVLEIYSDAVNSASKSQKLESYLALNSIRECFLIKSDEMRVEHYAKQNAKQWIYKIYNEREDVITIDAVNCKISLSELYAQIKFRPTAITSAAVN
ncbi:MAG: Uma2 family endonuclease [Pyrinomonadaceae bacterium]